MKYAFRALTREKAFTAFAVLTLARPDPGRVAVFTCR
jgi:hypothetical protein